MKNIIDYKICLFLVMAALLYGCGIEDDYCGRIHPHEKGFEVSIILPEGEYQYATSKTFKCIIYGSDSFVKAEENVTFKGMSTKCNYNLPYGSYSVFVYDMATNMQSRKMNLLGEGYFFVPTKNPDVVSDEKGREIVDVENFYLGGTEINYTNREPFITTNVVTKRYGYRVALRLRFTDDTFSFDDIAELTGTLSGVASVFGIQHKEIWEGNNSIRNLTFLRRPELEVTDPKCMYATMHILGNDLESTNGSILNDLNLTLKYSYDDKIVNLKYDLSQLLNGLNKDINIEIKIDLKGEPPIDSDITLDESWNDEEFDVDLNAHNKK